MAQKICVFVLVALFAVLALYAEAKTVQKRDAEGQFSDADKVIDDITANIKKGVETLKNMDFKQVLDGITSGVKDITNQAKEAGSKIFDQQNN